MLRHLLVSQFVWAPIHISTVRFCPCLFTCSSEVPDYLVSPLSHAAPNCCVGGVCVFLLRVKYFGSLGFRVWTLVIALAMSIRLKYVVCGLMWCVHSPARQCCTLETMASCKPLTFILLLTLLRLLLPLRFGLRNRVHEPCLRSLIVCVLPVFYCVGKWLSHLCITGGCCCFLLHL